MTSKPAAQSTALDLGAEPPRAWLSALADGEVDAAGRACELWRSDDEARRAWHSYHLIGDVMRSDELATAPHRDAAFMTALRARLASEPTVLAPAVTLSVLRGPRRPWLLPVAAAAGFAVVAGVLVVGRIGVPDGAGSTVFARGASQNTVAQAAGASPGETQTFSASAQAGIGAAGNDGAAVLIRDARLDEFLRVHQAARGGIAPPGLRAVAVPADARLDARGISASSALPR